MNIRYPAKGFVRSIQLTRIILFGSIICLQLQSVGQTANRDESVDEVISLIYRTISGPAGKRNWEQFKSVFHPEARMGALLLDQKQSRLAVFLPDGYIKNNDAFLQKQDFYEREIGRKTQEFGDLAQVMSAFEYRFAANGPVQARGINSIMLVREAGRWKVMSLLWQDETPKNQLPHWVEN